MPGHFGEDFDLGKGFNNLAGEVKGDKSAVKTGLKAKKENISNTFFYASIAQNAKEYSRIMSLDGGITAPASPIDLTASFSARSEINLKCVELYYVIQFYQENSIAKFKENVILDKKLAEKFCTDQFFSQYGDSYVSKIIYGKELITIIRFEFKTHDEKIKFESELKLGRMEVASLKAAFKYNTTLSERNIKFEVKMFQKGIVTDMPILTSLETETLEKWIKEISTKCVEDKSDPIELYPICKPYKDIIDFGKDQDSNLEHAGLMYDLINHARQFLNLISKAKFRAMKLLDILNSRGSLIQEMQNFNEVNQLVKNFNKVGDRIKLSKYSELKKNIEESKNEYKVNIEKLLQKTEAIYNGLKLPFLINVQKPVAYNDTPKGMTFRRIQIPFFLNVSDISVSLRYVNNDDGNKDNKDNEGKVEEKEIKDNKENVELKRDVRIIFYSHSGKSKFLKRPLQAWIIDKTVACKISKNENNCDNDKIKLSLQGEDINNYQNQNLYVGVFEPQGIDNFILKLDMTFSFNPEKAEDLQIDDFENAYRNNQGAKVNTPSTNALSITANPSPQLVMAFDSMKQRKSASLSGEIGAQEEKKVSSKLNP